MPRKPPPPLTERTERAVLAGPSLLPADLAGVMGEADFESDEIKTGVLAAVIDTGEILPLLKLYALAIRKSEELSMTCYVVRSGDKLYATNVPPLQTKDLDAMYLFEVAPPLRRGDVISRLFTAFRAMVARFS